MILGVIVAMMRGRPQSITGHKIGRAIARLRGILIDRAIVVVNRLRPQKINR